MRKPNFCLLALPLLFLTGCSFTDTGTPTETPAVQQGPALRGIAHGGRQPISGAKVYVLAASTSGYGAASTSLLNSNVATNNPSLYGQDGSNNYYVLTDSGGNFSVTGDYTCTTGQQVYLYITGGNPGAGTNTASGLLGVLGSCPVSGTFANTTPFVIVNEATTVAAAYAISGFATDATHVSSSGTALAQTGIANAFANASNLVDISKGQALTTTPAGNGTVPQATINTIANILAACVNTTGPTSTAFTTLFTNVLSSGATGTSATDTATAAIYLAHNPVPGHSEFYTSAGSPQIINLCNLQLPASPFGPPLPCVGNSSTSSINEAANSYPNDFTLSIQYSGMTDAPNIPVIDGSGNVWILVTPVYEHYAYTASKILEFSPLGVLLSPSSGYPITGGTAGGTSSRSVGLAFDQSGNGWIPYGDFQYSGNDHTTNNLVKVTPSGTATVCASTGTGGLDYPNSLTIDGKGNIWISDFATIPSTYYAVSEFDKNCNPITTLATNYTGGGLNGPGSMAADGAGNIWIGNLDASPYSLTVFANSGTPVTGSSGYTGGGLDEPYGLGIDSAGKVWTTNGLTQGVAEFYNSGSPVSASLLTGGGDSSTFLYSGSGPLSIDGAGNIWTVNLVDPFGSGTLPSALTEYGNDRSIISPFNGYTATKGYGYLSGAVPDGSGNIWTTAYYSCSCNTSTPTLNQFIGLSVPVVTPIAAGLPSTFTTDGSSNLGTRP